MKGKHRGTTPHPKNITKNRGHSSGGSPKLYGGAKPGVHHGVAGDHTMGMKGGHKAKTSH